MEMGHVLYLPCNLVMETYKFFLKLFILHEKMNCSALSPNHFKHIKKYMIRLGDDGFRELGLARDQPIKSTRTGDFIFFPVNVVQPNCLQKTNDNASSINA